MGLSQHDARCLKEIRGKIDDPRCGLPKPVFDFLLEVTPLTNVDLLLRDKAGRFLLVWREDEYGRGWHIPGGIIRFQETAEERILKTGKSELGLEVRPEPQPLSLTQIVYERGHFLSLLYACEADSLPPEQMFHPGGRSPDPGALSWFYEMPDDTYHTHIVYKDVLRKLGLTPTLQTQARA